MSDRMPIMSRGPGAVVLPRSAGYAKSGYTAGGESGGSAGLTGIWALMVLFATVAAAVLIGYVVDHGNRITVLETPAPAVQGPEHELYAGEFRVFHEPFDSLDHETWHHHVSLSDGGENAFQMFINHRRVSTVNGDGVFVIHPRLTVDETGEDQLLGTNDCEDGACPYDVGGTGLVDACTGAAEINCVKRAESGAILPPIQSARVSMRSFAFTHGRIEITARLPCGDWARPIFRLLPKKNVYGNFPASGQIDLLESRGNNCSFPGGGSDIARSSIHAGTSELDDTVADYRATLNQTEWCGYDNATNLCLDFHVYGAKWNSSGVWTYVDTEANLVLAANFTNGTFYEREFSGSPINPWEGGEQDAPFDVDFYLMFELAFGGVDGFFPDGAQGKPWTDADAGASETFYQAVGLWNATSYVGGTYKGSLEIDEIAVWQ